MFLRFLGVIFEHSKGKSIKILKCFQFARDCSGSVFNYYTFSTQMPGVDQMQGYNMRYGRSPNMELPLAINPSGCARSEPHLRTHFKR